MRVLPFVILIFLTLGGSAAFSRDLNTTNGSRNRTSDNNTQVLPYGFISLTNSAFDDLILHISEDWELDQLLGSNFGWTEKKFDGLNRLGLRNNAESRFLFGGFPFLSIPNKDRDERESTFFSTDKFLFFLYFNKKF